MDDLPQVLDSAVVAREFPHDQPELLEDEIVFCYFSKPSTRTRVSFAAAIAHLGGEAEFMGPGDLQLGRGETIEDTAMVVSGYARAAVIRTFDHADVVRFASAATIPVINALTDLHHPCQALADMLTIRDHFGALNGIRLAYVGSGNNVVHSLVQAGALTGVHTVVATPVELAPDSRIVEGALAAGGDVELVTDPIEAVTGADVVYTDVWLSMGDPPDEQEARRAMLAPYQVNPALLSRADDSAVFLHCLPAHRGDEVVDEVLDGERSLVAVQAENRLHTEQAMLAALLTGSLAGR